MSGLAVYLKEHGFTVSGSDANFSPKLTQLENLGIKVFYNHSARLVEGVDVVVYNSAISLDNPELLEAKQRDIPLIKRSELLGEILSQYKKSIAVSGSHGKTTATAMIAQVFICADMNPTVFLGGESGAFGNYRSGGNKIAIAEACEYKRNFLDLTPSVAVVLNIDKDHMDSYKDMNDLTDAFCTFTKGRLAVVNADDVYAKNIENQSIITYAVNSNATFTATKIKYNGKGYSFTVNAFGRAIGRINLSVIGRHNIYNALASIVVCDLFGISFKKIKKGLESFPGVKRRSEYLGEYLGKSCYGDYAHHPAEISATLGAFEDSGKDYAVVFQPHTYTRTEKLMEDFILSLSKCKNLIIYKTFPAREKYYFEGSESALFENLKTVNKGAKLAMDESQLTQLLGDFDEKIRRIIFMGAGDIYEIASDIISYTK